MIRKLRNFLVFMAFKYHQVRLYWARRFAFNEVAEPKDRLFTLRVNLHSVDNVGSTEAQQKANMLWKVQPVITAVRTRCL